jgi:hypothetical protein
MQTSPASGWGDDDLGGLDLSLGGSMASHPGGPSAYSGGGLGFGDEDDPFADDAPQGALELDLPPSHSASAPRSMPAQSAAAVSTPTDGSSGSVPDLVLPTPRGAPSSTPSLPAVRSDPSLAPAPSPPRSGPSLTSAGPQSPPSFPAESPSQPQVSPQPEPVSALPAVPAPPDPAAMIARYPAPPSKIWEAPVYAMKVLWRQVELRQDLASLRKRRSPDVALYERALKTHDPKTFTLGLVITCAGLTLAMFVFFLPVILRFLRDPG